ncbi:MAG: hypothetical protein ACD_60C00045G0011 [uncultured bacterium]|nr:MAG: hypothetical protein ACD_60C00045G0011 [uncultured bacterium]
MRSDIGFFIFLIVYSALAHASVASDELLKLLDNTHSMQAGFIQKVSDTKGRVINQTEGQMAMQRPGKFRWDTKKPTAQLIVTDGKRLWIYDPDLEQVTIRFLETAAGETPALLLSNTNTTLEKDFRIEEISNHSTTRWFLLRPHDQGSVFALIKLGFVNNQIKEMQLQDRLGHMTAIQFNRVSTNQNVSPALFAFKIPAHVDVIDETRRLH